VKSDSSYSFQFNEMARPARFELATLCLEGRRSIHLSYGRIHIDSKTFAPGKPTLLDVTLCAKGKRGCTSALAADPAPAE
jgi:hypothetical protein